MEKQIIGWSKNSPNPLRNFLSKPSKPLISISIQNEAEPLNPDETDHLSLAQLKQQKQTKKRQKPEWTHVTSKTKGTRTDTGENAVYCA